MDLFTELIVLLVLNIKIYHCQEYKINVPLILELRNDSYEQRLYVKWNVSNLSNTSSSEIIFHFQVSRHKEMKIIFNEYFNTTLNEQLQPFTWSWKSDLPLECASHSVRIRSSVDGKYITEDKEWSIWSPWKTFYGADTADLSKTLIFPYNKIVHEGSSISFCCIPEKKKNVVSLSYYNGAQIISQSTFTNNETFIINVKNVSLTKPFGANVICNLSPSARSGTVLFVTKPPDKPKHLSCETQDIVILKCSWDPGKESNLYGIRAIKYTLHEQLSGKNSSSCSRDSCAWPIERGQMIYNFTLTAVNALGKRSINSIINITERVRPLTPTNLEEIYLNSSHISLNWMLNANYTGFKLICQTELQKNGTVELRNITMNGEAKSPYSVNLERLQPNTNYKFRVRYITDTPVSKWGNWSETYTFKTQECAPAAAPDIWRDVKENGTGRSVILYWRHLPESYARGNVISYNVFWQPLDDTSETKSKTISPLHNRTQINIDSRAYVIRMTVQNGAGISPPSELRIPDATENDSRNIKEEKANGTKNGVLISWSCLPNVFHGFVIDWCNYPRSEHCDFQWKKISSNFHNDVIVSDAFKAGVRYDFRIHGLNVDGGYLLAYSTGFKQELAPSVAPQVKISNMESQAISITWESYPTGKSQEGFIVGYNVYLKSTGGGCEIKEAKDLVLSDGSHVCKFVINDPEKKNFMIRGLYANTKYEIRVTALTGGGESPYEIKNMQTPSNSQGVFLAIILPVIIFSIIVLILSIMTYWKRRWIQEYCYPVIPDPRKGQLLSLDGLKANSDKKVMIPTACITQSVQIVNVQEAIKVENSEVNKNSTDLLPGLILNHVDVNYKNCCHLEESTDSNAYTDDTEHESSGVGDVYKTFSQPPLQTYIEFFNNNYCISPDDGLDILPNGYKPQLEPSQPTYAHTNQLQSLSSMTNLSLMITSSEDLHSFTSDQSPTSTTSSTLLLKD
ncbi:oncostatin-M-specific receptor subunit beta [Bombina bombina]|uniref:oncostatin-M-specific receptor subunit beta n=1 Tax=Bombina bombina TaxID=8345 RepID=UPI00235AD9E5|nr:oncostatin-M-specific receptor subunit beta [Bombina bombina]XP_053557194.1 oncostatin-M-specific receptor subunit beta [Bombina bombina]